MTMAELFSFVKNQYPSILGETWGFDYAPTLSEYPSPISKKQWISLLKNPDITNPKHHLRMLKMMLELGGESTCSNLAKTYGGNPSYYNGIGTGLGRKIYRETGCQLYSVNGHETFFTIPFLGRYTIENGKRRFSWKIRKELMEALKEMDMSGIDTTPINTEFDVTPIKTGYGRNIILYGPPGTGKTYSSAMYAVAICDGISINAVRSMEYTDVMNRYSELWKSGRIAFTTFHQSYGYEEFIEGIKPVLDGGDTSLGYKIEDGIFKSFCESARTHNTGIDRHAAIWLVRLNGNGDNDLKTECFQNGEIRFNWHDGIDNNRDMKLLRLMKPGDYIVSSYSKGTVVDAVGVISDEEPIYVPNRTSSQWLRKVNWLATDLKENIKSLNSGKYPPDFQISKLPHVKVSNLLSLVKKNREDGNEPFVFIIDEINRGNISKIFGELITLIETSKREGMKEHIPATLPYSGDSFGIPENVYLLGTMNTADRSIALMDTALRRRFQFIEMMPDSSVLDGIIIKGTENRDLNVSKMMDTINERITFLYDREHTIGHAYFMCLKKSPTIETLASIFQESIIPLLQEYFYEDYQKIRLVLGDNGKAKELQFIQAEVLKPELVFKGNVDDAIDLPEQKYSLNNEAFMKLDSYIEII